MGIITGITPPIQTMDLSKVSSVSCPVSSVSHEVTCCRDESELLYEGNVLSNTVPYNVLTTVLTTHIVVVTSAVGRQMSRAEVATNKPFAEPSDTKSGVRVVSVCSDGVTHSYEDFDTLEAQLGLTKHG